MDSANGVASSDGDSIAIPVGDAPHFATAQRFALPTVTQMTALWASLRGGGRPVELVGIDAYHQFYAEDQPGHQVKKGYHFIVYRDNRITLLCDHDEYQQVVTFARQLLKASPYRTN